MSSQSSQDRFIICSKGIEVVLLLCIIIISIIRSIRIWLDKSIDCQQQLCIQTTQQQSRPLKNEKQPPKEGQQIQQKKFDPFQSKSLGFKILYRMQMIIKDYSFLGVVILNIICFTSYEYLLVTLIIYLVFAMLKIQTLIKPKSICWHMILQRVPNLIFVLGWFLNLFAITNTDIF